MKLKNTPSRKKFIPFAGAFIEVPVKSEWLAVNHMGVVYATEMPPYVKGSGVYSYDSDAIEISYSAMLVAHVEGHHVAQVIKIEDLMAGIA